MQQTIGTSPVRLDVPTAATPIVQNLGPGNVFLGDAAVTTGTGLKLSPNSAFEFPRDLGQGFGGLFAVADAAGTDVRYLVVG